ncbi:unnamed protein product [Brachionus calyciflorus]|uniref:Apple domain-containing protein n=1 Tax=Brachionus calyciflorus TaxID=104777 RepID=A0A814K8H1_9BILA|nr:unnamed protein product [Brachionus calyciflorus]
MLNIIGFFLLIGLTKPEFVRFFQLRNSRSANSTIVQEIKSKYLIRELVFDSKIKCGMACLSSKNCTFFNYNEVNETLKSKCEIYSSINVENAMVLKESGKQLIYSKNKACTEPKLTKENSCITREYPALNSTKSTNEHTLITADTTDVYSNLNGECPGNLR